MFLFGWAEWIHGNLTTGSIFVASSSSSLLYAEKVMKKKSNFSSVSWYIKAIVLITQKKSCWFQATNYQRTNSALIQRPCHNPISSFVSSDANSKPPNCLPSSRWVHETHSILGENSPPTRKNWPTNQKYPSHSRVHVWVFWNCHPRIWL